MIKKAQLEKCNQTEKKTKSALIVEVMSIGKQIAPNWARNNTKNLANINVDDYKGNAKEYHSEEDDELDGVGFLQKESTNQRLVQAWKTIHPHMLQYVELLPNAS